MNICIDEYPKEISLTPAEKQNCEDQDLKKSGKFYVKKESLSSNRYKFTASMDLEEDDGMSTIVARTGGICDNVKTAEGYRRCGLAKYLVATCFQDESILEKGGRGVDIKENSHWNKEPKRLDAYNYCKSVTYLQCKPYAGTPTRACVSYIRAGKLAEFEILFTKDDWNPMNAFLIDKQLEGKFVENAYKFIEDFGDYWYFCKCKSELKKECKAMVTFNQ